MVPPATDQPPGCVGPVTANDGPGLIVLKQPNNEGNIRTVGWRRVRIPERLVATERRIRLRVWHATLERPTPFFHAIIVEPSQSNKCSRSPDRRHRAA